MEDALRERVRAHLVETGVLEQLRGVISSAVGTDTTGTSAPADLKKGLRAAQQRGAVAQAVHSLATEAPFRSSRTMPLAAAESCLLHVQLLGGRAFIDPAMVSRGGELRVCGQLGEHRFASRGVGFATEPALDGSFLVPLPMKASELEPRGPTAAAAAPRCARLLGVRDHLHLLVVQQAGEEAAPVVVSSVLVDWRRVLTAGKCTLSVELTDVAAPAADGAPPAAGAVYPAGRGAVGAIELRFELLPSPAAEDCVSEAALMAALKAERGADVDAERAFHRYARRWWDEYLALSPSHRERLVKLYAMSELGSQRPAPCFVRPIRADRLVESAHQAAHFVSLIGYESADAHRVGTASFDTWHTAHSTLARGVGGAEEHATLLCSLLLGFGLDAYVALGTDAQGPHAWVLTATAAPAPSAKGLTPAEPDVVFWEPLSGRRYPRPAGRPTSRADPFRTLSCVFRHDALYANVQPDERADAISYRLDDRTCWKAMDAALLAPLAPLPVSALTPSPIVDRAAAEEAVETALREQIEAHRVELGLACAWDAQMSALLAPALLSYETERMVGASVGSAEFESAVKRAVPVGATFKGYPLHFTHARPAPMFASVLRSEVGASIVQGREKGARLAVRARVAPYPDGLCSTWLMVASITD